MSTFKIGIIPQKKSATATEGEVLPLQDPQLQELVSATTFADPQQAVAACKDGIIESIVYAQPNSLPEPQGEEMLITVSSQLRIACATNAPDEEHAAKQLSVDFVTKRIKQLDQIAHRDFLLTRPRVAILSLHADDQHEETDILMPAIDDAMTECVNVFGPFPPVAFFEQGDYRSYDVILALYPGQIKTVLSMTNDDDAVSYLTHTDLMQVSPCHEAVVDAIFLSKDILRNRHNFDEANNNPLQKLYHEKRER